MNINSSQAVHECQSDLQMDGLVQSLSQWAELDAMANVQASRSMLPGSCYGKRLMQLQAARRFLNVRIEDEQRIGMPTAALEQELEAKRVETRSYLAYLEDASVRLWAIFSPVLAVIMFKDAGRGTGDRQRHAPRPRMPECGYVASHAERTDQFHVLLQPT